MTYKASATVHDADRRLPYCMNIYTRSFICAPYNPNCSLIDSLTSLSYSFNLLSQSNITKTIDLLLCYLDIVYSNRCLRHSPGLVLYG